MDTHDFEKLDTKEQVKVFHQVPFKDRGDLLFHANDPSLLVKSLSPEELYLVTKEMDLDEKGEAIKHASAAQLLFLGDIECWQKDRLDARKFVDWLATLEKSDDSRLLGWLLHTDYETVIAGLIKSIEVIKPNREYAIDEILGDRPYFTLDEMYFIASDEENLETVRRALEVLFENHKGRYHALLEGVLSELEDEVEEEAFRIREGRLAERGFADFETAHKLMQPMSQEEFDHYPRKDIRALIGENAKKEHYEKMPLYPVMWTKERFFLEDVLLSLREEPDMLEAVYEELAMLSNKVLALDGLDFSSEERVREGVERARSFVSIGLEFLSDRDIALAGKIIREHWVENIFKRGVTQVMLLQKECRAWIRDYWKAPEEYLCRFLNPPYEFVVKGLLKSFPFCYDSEAKNSTDFLRDFKTKEEIERARPGVRQLANIFKAIASIFPDYVKKLDLADPDPEIEVTLFSVIGTMLASHIVRGKISCQALTEKQLADFLKKAFNESAGRRSLKPEIKTAFVKEFFPDSAGSDSAVFWALLFSSMEEELGELQLGQNFNSKFITTVLVKKG